MQRAPIPRPRSLPSGSRTANVPPTVNAVCRRLVRETLMTYRNYWSIPPEEISSRVVSKLEYPPNLTIEDIDFAADTSCKRRDELSNEQLALALYFLNAYTYGGLLAQSLYYRLVAILRARDGDKLMRLLQSPLPQLVPEIYNNKSLLEAEYTKIEKNGLQGIIAMWSVVEKLMKDPSLIAKYTELLPCRSISAQVCSTVRCSNFYVNCHQKIQFEEFDFEDVSPALNSTETMIIDDSISELVPLRSLLLEFASAIKYNRHPQIKSRNRALNSQMQDFIVNTYKAEIKVYSAFIDWFNGSDWNQSGSSA